MNCQRINSIAGGVKKKLESSKNRVDCRKSSENTWIIKESSLLQEEFRKYLSHQRIKSIAGRVQKKLESSKNQFYCKSSEKTWIIEESIQNKPQETHQSSEEKKKKKEKTRQQEEEDDDEGMQV